MRVIEEAATDRAQTPHGARAEDVRSPRHEGTDRRVHPFVECAGSYAWRLLTIGLAVAALLWLLGHVLVVVVPVAVAFLLPAPRVTCSSSTVAAPVRGRSACWPRPVTVERRCGAGSER